MHIEIGGSGRDWYDLFTFGFGVAATLIAGLGGVIALRSYVATNRATAHNHMHHMFERFLEARDTHAERLTRASRPRRHRPPTSLREDSDFGGSALYYLEEVYAWVCREERLLSDWAYRLLFPRDGRSRRRRLDIAASWRATVVTQLISHRQDVLDSLLRYSSCYGVEFLDFAARTLNHPALSARAEESRHACANGLPRPLGDAELEQQRTVAALPSRGIGVRLALFLLGLGVLYKQHARPTLRS